ncbi:hypothetical protein O7626_40260 [Micromonospora sp. WMMD1102]|uniref:hypothetical protein n=1 Tax=Micromonospora sp. WMMD1102 TaxID=3016105 RepID=UPI00241551D8|nr:hypothetical protein [Micromonospora sp. WMMD1102]MDG4792052.1 hypothetical protein [Micromonospora sp. WMMD1102]
MTVNTAKLAPNPVTLSPTETRLLREAAANNGLIHVGAWTSPKERKAVEGLVRKGVFSPGSAVHGGSARHITKHGRRVLAELDAKGQ